VFDLTGTLRPGETTPAIQPTYRFEVVEDGLGAKASPGSSLEAPAGHNLGIPLATRFWSMALRISGGACRSRRLSASALG
jgi:hypothetical protein